MSKQGLQCCDLTFLLSLYNTNAKYVSLDPYDIVLLFFFSKHVSYCSNTSFISYTFSLRAYHKKLLLGEIIRRSDLSVADADMVSCWRSDPDVISAVWALVDLCSSSSIANEASSVLADFISRVCFQP
jgi:hypothetical protein